MHTTTSTSVSTPTVFKPRVFKPREKGELRAAVVACIKRSAVGDCANGLNGPIGGWDVSSMTEMSGIFFEARAFNADISKWHVSSVTDMSGIFYEARVFNADISKWDVSSVTDMNLMFAYATSFNGDISAWDVSRMKDMSSMFYGATAFERTLCGAWAYSKAQKHKMFHNSPGSICRTTTTTAKTTITATIVTADSTAKTTAGKHANCILISSSPINDRPRIPILTCTRACLKAHLD